MMPSQARAVEQSSLKLAYARFHLAETGRRRHVFLAAQAGMTQREIAKAVHMSQATVHRVIRQAKVLSVEESIEEIALSRFVGEIDTEEMMSQLGSFPQWVARVVDPLDGILPGDSESEVDALVADGFLSNDEANAIVAAHD
jgi:predicted DNA-binding protein (UPF0251 family)